MSLNGKLAKSAQASWRGDDCEILVILKLGKRIRMQCMRCFFFLLRENAMDNRLRTMGE